MSTDTYLAVFLGSKTSPQWAAWNAMSETARKAKEQEGMAAWKGWVEKHQGAIQAMGGPLGKTKKVDGKGVADIANEPRAPIDGGCSPSSVISTPASFSASL